MQRTLFTGIDSNFYSKFTLKMCVNFIACFEINLAKSKFHWNYIIYTNHHVKLTIFLLLPVSALNTIVHN